MLYSVMSAEILWICKATTKFHDFVKFATILIETIIKDGGLTNNNMKHALLKLFNSSKSFVKFGKTNDCI